ncbi:LPS assembly lipoprotein LptE [Planctomycetota bacterium]
MNMYKTRSFRLVFLVYAAGIFLFPACAYRMHARLPLQYSRIFIKQFENKTTEEFLGYELTKYVRQEIVERTSVSLAHDSQSAVSLGGVITKIGRGVISKDSIGTVLSERLTVQINVQIKPVSGSVKKFSVIGAKVYTRTGMTVRRQMVREACKDAASQIIHRLIQREVTTDVR